MKKPIWKLIIGFIFICAVASGGEFSKKDYSKILISDFKKIVKEYNKKGSKYNQYTEIKINDMAQGILDVYKDYYSLSELEFVRKNILDIGTFSPILTKYTNSGLHVIVISDGFSPKGSNYWKSANRYLNNENGYDVLYRFEDIYKKNSVMPIAVYVEDLSKEKKKADFSMDIIYNRDGRNAKYVMKNNVNDYELVKFCEKNKAKLNLSNEITFGEWSYFIMEEFLFFGAGIINMKIDNEEVIIE